VETKKAIEFVKSKMHRLLSYEHKEEDDGDMIKIKKITDEWGEVISLLQQGEKYKHKKEGIKMTENISTTTDSKPIRVRCANCEYIFEGILYICPKCGSNAIDKININEPNWIS